MNIRNQEKLKLKFCMIFLICISNSIKSIRGQDFQFDNDNAEDFQTILSEPLEVVSKAQQITKSQDKATKCPQSENKIFLSLVLRTHNWDNVLEKKRQKAINKLSKFLMVPKENFILDDVSRAEIHEMSTSAIRSGRNHLNRNIKLGRIQFLIGCGKNVFPSEKLIVNQIHQQIKDNTIEEITGLDFGWWVIWKQKQQQENYSQITRSKREANDIEDEEDDDYYEDGENDEDDEESATDVPTQHPHRHHHGDSGLSTIPLPSSTEKQPKVPIIEEDEDNYDDEYEDEDDGGAITHHPHVRPVPVTTERSTTVETTTELLTTTPAPTTQPPTTTTEPTTTEKITTTPAPTTTTTEQYIEEIVNTPPFVKTRIPKQALTAGKVYTFIVPENTFFDQEDGTTLKLALSDKTDQALKGSSWLQFNPETREIYALPLENTVSRWNYILRATDSAGDSATESLDVTVQQHKSHRSVNHEISIALKLNDKFVNNVDWELKAIRGISETMGDASNNNVVVRDIRFGTQDPSSIVFVYTNETIPKDRCPEETLDALVAKLDQDKLNENLGPEFTVKSVTGQQIGSCMKAVVPTKKPSKSPVVNYGPQLRNPIDRINATVGNLLVFKVPTDTFYDPEDANDLTLSLRTADNVKVDAHHWLQFDSKNNEFYGIPKSGDIGNREYLLQAEDSGGKTSTDALIVYVNHWHKRDFGVLFEMDMDYPFESFNVSLAQRRFVERVASALGDDSTAHIHIRNIRPLHHNGHILVSYYNTTLHKMHMGCPNEEIEEIKNVLIQSDGLVRDKIRESIGADFKLQNVRLIPMGSCQGHGDPPTHDEITIKPDEALPPPVGRDDYLLTFIVPAAIIITMLLIAAIIACILYRRRLTGKMELGDEEERKSFRSKGIPVIFQDELDEKPEIGNKSPIILKDEKPPLLPPSYSSTNGEENEDMDDYVPPPAVVMGGRESRGKSPVTPSYRKPPPYVSP